VSKRNRDLAGMDPNSQLLHQPDLLAHLLASWLPLVDFIRLASLNREWRSALSDGEAACWEALLRRDFCEEATRRRQRQRQARISTAQLYRHIWQGRGNWRLGRSFPPVRPSPRANGLLLLNDADVVAEIGAFDDVIRVWQAVTTQSNKSIVLNNLGSATPSSSGDDTSAANRAVIDAALSDGPDNLNVAGGGLNGAWIQRVALGEDESTERTRLGGSEHKPIYHVVRDSRTVAASVSGSAEDLLLWDANRPDTVLFKANSFGFGDAIGLHILSIGTDHRISLVFPSGQMVDVDVREGKSRVRTFVEHSLQAGLSSPIQASAVSPTSRVLATSRCCLSYDTRYLSESIVSFDQAAVTWSMRNVSSLVVVNERTTVAGIKDGWQGPIVVLNDDGSSRRIIYSQERYYRVLGLRANASLLAATCTDHTRLFGFSPPLL